MLLMHEFFAESYMLSSEFEAVDIYMPTTSCDMYIYGVYNIDVNKSSQHNVEQYDIGIASFSL